MLCNFMSHIYKFENIFYLSKNKNVINIKCYYYNMSTHYYNELNMFLLSWTALETNRLYMHLFSWFACLACLLLL